MPTFLALFEYVGTPYSGWQAQPGLKTVQGEIEAALKVLTRRPVPIQACGRTDAGVHALAMPVSFAVEGLDADRLRAGLNGILAPQPIACLEVQVRPDGFNARFDCLARAYEYRILPRRARPALSRGAVLWVPVPLDVEAMNRATSHLVGTHDFTTFRSSECQAASPVKTLDLLRVLRRGEEIVVETAAKSFLHHQVRRLIGSLIQVGKGRWTPDRLRAALEARDPSASGPMSAAEGLYFVRGDYPNAPTVDPH